jgi:thioredoxin reductase (NADPH)
MNDRSFTLNLNSSIKKVDLENKTVYLADGKIINSKFLVIATGIKRRTLDIPGEIEFQGRGIIKSGKRDGQKVKGKKVAVIGGGDAAFENCQILSEFADRIVLIHRSKDFRARSEFVEPAKKNPKVELITETSVEKILGNGWVKELELKDSSKKKTYRIPVDFILFRIGVEPNTQFFNGLIEFNERNYIVVNNRCETNIKGVYAIGDVANPVSPTISSAVGMGATAIKSILLHIN